MSKLKISRRKFLQLAATLGATTALGVSASHEPALGATTVTDSTEGQTPIAFGAKGAGTAVSGSVTAGSKTLTLSTLADFAPNDRVVIAGRGTNGHDLIATLIDAPTGSGPYQWKISAPPASSGATTIYHDDAPAIERCMEANGGLAYLAPILGGYAVSLAGHIDTPSGSSIVDAGGYIQRVGALTAGDGFLLGQTSLSTPTNNILLDGVHIKANGQSWDGGGEDLSAGTMLRFGSDSSTNRATNVTIRNLEVDFWPGILAHLRNIRGLQIEGCRIYGAFRGGFQLYYKCGDTVITDNEIHAQDDCVAYLATGNHTTDVSVTGQGGNHLLARNLLFQEDSTGGVCARIAGAKDAEVRDNVMQGTIGPAEASQSRSGVFRIETQSSSVVEYAPFDIYAHHNVFTNSNASDVFVGKVGHQKTAPHNIRLEYNTLGDTASGWEKWRISKGVTLTQVGNAPPIPGYPESQ